MKIFLISNNSLLDNINYDSSNLELVRMLRPLSIKGEDIAKEISKLEYLKNVETIYSSFYSSSISSAKYLANNLELNVEMNMNLNDCKVGILGSKNMKMVKGLQEHDFNYKLPNGESLVDVGNRLNEFIKNLGESEIAIFTHKRAILGFLLKYATVGYNLDDNLILEYNNEIVYDDSDTEYDIYEINISDEINIKKLV